MVRWHIISTADRLCDTNRMLQPRVAEVEHGTDRALLEADVADRQHLVDEQHVGVDVRGHGEAEAGVHAAGVLLHGRVDVGAELGEVDDLLEARAHLGARQAKDHPVEQDVLATGQLAMEAGAEVDQRGNAAVGGDRAAGRPGDARQQLERGRLPGAIGADQADGFAVTDGEADVAERPERLVLATLVAFPDVVQRDGHAGEGNGRREPRQAAGLA